MCLIDTWGMLRGVSRSVEGADWLALYVPVTHPGLAFYRGACRLVSSTVAWLERGESTIPESGLPAAVSVSERKGECYECDDWY